MQYSAWLKTVLVKIPLSNLSEIWHQLFLLLPKGITCIKRGWKEVAWRAEVPMLKFGGKHSDVASWL